MADEENAGTENLKPSKKKLIIIVAIAVVLVLAIAGGAMLWLSGDSTDNADAVVVEERSESMEYYALNPPFVMSYLTRSGQRYLQLGISVASHKPKVLETLELHDPKVRSEMLRIIGEQGFNELRTPSGKEKLRQELTSRLNAIVREEAQIEGVEAVLFNNFVIQ